MYADKLDSMKQISGAFSAPACKAIMQQFSTVIVF
jgi:hypothetical protein